MTRRNVTIRTMPSTTTLSSTMTSFPPAPLPVEQPQQPRQTMASEEPKTAPFDADAYTKPFISFMHDNPTVFHAVAAMGEKLIEAGFHPLTEREVWDLEKGGKYFYTRNGSGLIAFTVGEKYAPGNGAAVIAAHIDALTAKVKPVSTKPTSGGFEQLGVAQYAGGLNQTWFDRDLGIGGRVFVKDSKSGKIDTHLVKLDWPVARIPTIAPHFGIPAEGQANRETRMVPIVGIDNSDLHGSVVPASVAADSNVHVQQGASGSFASTQPKRLLQVIAGELGVKDYSSIVNWELEVFDFQGATLGGLDKDFIFAGRIDDKLCSFAAIEGLLASSPSDSGILKVVGLFDDEEVGSLLRQGANSNFLPSTIERIVDSFSEKSATASLYQTYANSFLVSADVCHAFNPNYADVYLKDHAPRLNVGVAVSFDSNAHMTTDGESYALFNEIAKRSDSTLQLFQIRNDSRSGGTVGPMLSARTGMRAIDAGIPQLSMHSIRATTGRLDPGLGVKLFKGFFEHFEKVDKEFA